MNKFLLLIGLLYLFGNHTDIYAQRITTELYSGINFSDIHGNFESGKRLFKPGPVQGLRLSYSFNKVLGIQTGLDYLTLYYEYLPYYGNHDYYPLYNPMPPFYYYPSSDKMDFSFLRIPALFRLSTPTRIKYNLTAGVYFSFRQHYSLNYIYSPKPDKKDIGFLCSTGLAYPLGPGFEAAVNISYTAGKREMIEGTNFKHGSTELTFGFGYNGFLKKASLNRNNFTGNDSSLHSVFLKYMGGMNLSWNAGNRDIGKYSLKTGPSAGLALNYKFAGNTSLQTEILFQRNGYALKDSSTSFYLFNHTNNQMYEVNTKTDIDYIVIPLLLNISIGQSDMFFINTGPYAALRLNARCTGEATSVYRTETSYSLRKTNVYDDIEGLFKNNDWGWILGGGVSIPVTGKNRIEIEFRYNKGFKDVFDTSGFTDKPAADPGKSFIRNGSLSLLLGLKLPIY